VQTFVNNPQLGTPFPDKIDKIVKKVVIHTLSDVILGDFHCRPRLRLIDDLISGDPYIAITNATVYDKSGKARFKTKFLSVNRDHIVLIIPWEDLETKPDDQQFAS